ncbi:MAG: NAD(P)H-hydrate dehydratase [candidate division NC10 bacterium]|nr:NAD(P)H-hydrate dehydratase [candidate division NC10 bacterium]
MVPVVSASQMQCLDRRAVAECGIPSLLLMENAGAETTRELLAAFPALPAPRVVILSGRGNNGGDGFVVARRLLARGSSLQTFLLARREDVQGDARVNLEILERMGAAPLAVSAAELPLVRDAIGSADIVVDALLGTGARGPARDLAAEAIGLVNRAGRPVVAVDIPSGLEADSPELPGPAVRADLTVTFALPKPCLLVYPAAAMAGRVRVADIGIPRSLLAGAGIRLHLLEAADVRPAFPPRDPWAHKGTFGHVLVLAGSLGKTGAAALCGQAAQRSGAGLVTVGAPASLNDILEVKLTEVMTEPLPETEARTLALEGMDRILRLAEGKAAVAIGPGVGTHPSTQELVRRLVASLPLPLVLDADGLTAFAGQPDLLSRAAGPVILTPHPGELSRLLSVKREEIIRRRLTLVPEVAGRLQATLLLKTARSLVADPDGQAFLVPTGNPGLACGGTGDVLTGLIAGLAAQGCPPGLAARAGAVVHGLAGDLAAGQLGAEAMIASDVLTALSEAIRQVKEAESGESGVKRGV